LSSYSENTRAYASLESRYANYFKIGHNAFEFVLEFGQFYDDGEDRVTIHSRIVTSPTYAKHLLQTLSIALGQYEADHGDIEEKK
jgi:hypothetical protein